MTNNICQSFQIKIYDYAHTISIMFELERDFESEFNSTYCSLLSLQEIRRTVLCFKKDIILPHGSGASLLILHASYAQERTPWTTVRISSWTTHCTRGWLAQEGQEDRAQRTDRPRPRSQWWPDRNSRCPTRQRLGSQPWWRTRQPR